MEKRDYGRNPHNNDAKRKLENHDLHYIFDNLFYKYKKIYIGDEIKLTNYHLLYNENKNIGRLAIRLIITIFYFDNEIMIIFKKKLINKMIKNLFKIKEKNKKNMMIIKCLIKIFIYEKKAKKSYGVENYLYHLEFINKNKLMIYQTKLKFIQHPIDKLGDLYNNEIIIKDLKENINDIKLFIGNYYKKQEKKQNVMQNKLDILRIALRRNDYIHSRRIKTRYEVYYGNKNK